MVIQHSIDQLSRFLYDHVQVITNVKKKSDFQSEFLAPSEDADKLIFSGYLKVIDPVTKSVILSLIDLDQRLVLNNILILGQHIESIVKDSPKDTQVDTFKIGQILETDSLKRVSTHPFYKRDSETILSDQGLKDRLVEIISWLEKNRIPVSLDESCNELIVGDLVRIKPPYEHVSDYICPTRILLKRIKHIIDDRGRGAKAGTGGDVHEMPNNSDERVTTSQP